MNKYTFSTQNGRAYYSNSIPGFIKDNINSVLFGIQDRKEYIYNIRCSTGGRLCN